MPSKMLSFFSGFGFAGSGSSFGSTGFSCSTFGGGFSCVEFELVLEFELQLIKRAMHKIEMIFFIKN